MKQLKFLPTLISFLLLAILPRQLLATALDVNFSQKNTSNTAWTNVIVPPVANGVMSYSSAKVPISSSLFTFNATTGSLGVSGTGVFGSYLDTANGIGTPVAGHAQYGGSSSYGASIIGNGSAYDFGLFNKNGTDVMHVATGGTTVAFAGAINVAGASVFGSTVSAAAQILTSSGGLKSSNTGADGLLTLARVSVNDWNFKGGTNLTIDAGGSALFTLGTTGAAAFAGQLIGKGTATNDNAATGYIGEYVSSTVASGSAITLTNATAANVTSLSLSAGDWDVSGVITFNGAVTGSYSTAGISTTSATHQAYPNSIDSPYLPTAAANVSTVIPALRISIASTTTVYLVALEAFSSGTAKAYGFISARRVR